MTSKNHFIVRITNALFKQSLSKTAQPVFSKPISHFEIKPNENWVLWGPGKAKMMNILSNKYLCESPTSMSFMKLNPHVEQVQFKGVIPTAHLSARYEYYKDEFDQTCKQFILDNGANSNKVSYKISTSDRKVNMELYNKLIKS